LLPAKIHLTVPLAFRKPAPQGCVLRRATLNDSGSRRRQETRTAALLSLAHRSLEEPRHRHPQTGQLGFGGQLLIDVEQRRPAAGGVYSHGL
jgi:hypothetical protein